jgi:hypothetical protein
MPLNGAKMYGLREAEYRDPEALTRGQNWYGEYKEDLFSAAKDGSIHTWRLFVRKWYAFHDDHVLRDVERLTTADLKDLLAKLRLHYQAGWKFTDPWFNSLLLPEVFSVTVLVHRLAEGSDGKKLEFWSDAFVACSVAGHLKYERQGAKGRLYVDVDTLAPDATEALVRDPVGVTPQLLQSYVRRNLSRLTEEAARESRRAH